MAENGQKNCRKSRLEPRECTDFALEKYSHLQEDYSPLIRSDTQENCEEITSESTSGLKFNIEVKVEKCDETMVERSDPEEYENLEMNAPTTSKSEVKDIGPELVRCKMDDETLRRYFEEMSKTTTCVADKLLEVEIKNELGKYATIQQLDRHETLIQEAIANWKIWNSQSKLRDSIFSYKCYICSLAWWHLTGFRDHIKLHDNLKVDIEIYHNECHLICYDKCLKRQDIDMEEHCPRCLKSPEMHMPVNRHSEIYFFCQGCRARFLTCSNLIQHESICQRYHKMLFTDIVRHESDWKCNICELKCLTKDRYDRHMVSSHSVRSDLAVAAHQMKQCEYCNENIFMVNTHTCTKKHCFIKCRYCCRKFQTRWFVNLHESMSKNDVHCKVCNTYLKKQCMEMEHMITHSENYVLSYRCTLCADYTLFPDEFSIKRHRTLKHNNLKGWDKKRMFCEIMVVPKLCLMKSNMPKLSRKKTKSKNINSNTEPPVKRIKNVSDAHDAIINNENYDKVLNIKNEIHSEEDDITITDKKQLQTEINIKQENEVSEEEMAILNLKTEVEEPLSNVFQVSKNLNRFKEPSSTILIDKELEYEKALSKVFQSTTGFTTTEPYVIDVDLLIKEEPIDNDEYEDDIIVLNKNFIHDHEDINLAGSSNFYLKETHDLNEGICEETYNESNEVNETKGEIKTSSTKGKNNKISVKKDHEGNITKNSLEDIEHDINNFSPIKRNTVKKLESDVSIDVEMSNLEPEINIFDGFRVKKRYKCTKCDFIGYHREYKRHVDFLCKKPTDNTNKKEYSNDEIWGLFHCTKCDEKFETLRLYLLHFREHNLPFGSCPHCDLVFTQTSKLVLHLTKHIKQCYTKVYLITDSTSDYNVLYKCTSCSDVLKYDEFFVHWEKHFSLNIVKDEVEIHDEDSENEVVGETALSAEEVQALIGLLQMDTKKYWRLKQIKDCAICAKSFERRNDCKRHLIEHLLVDAFANKPKNSGLMCQICQTVFLTANAYKKHMRDHGYLPIYTCQLCDKSFSDSSNFAKHKKVHNLKVLLCDICKKKYASKQQLVKHLKLHEISPPVKCDECDQIFYEKSLLRKHMRHHTGYRSRVRCPICRQRFLSLKEKWDHMWTVHGERSTEADCLICHMSFRKFQDLKKHMKDEHKTHISKPRHMERNDASNIVSALRQHKPNEGTDIASILRQLESYGNSERASTLRQSKDGSDFISKLSQLESKDGSDFISKPRQLDSDNGRDFVSKPRQLDSDNGRDFVSKPRQLDSDNGRDFVSKSRQLDSDNGKDFVSKPRQLKSDDGSTSIQSTDTLVFEIQD